MSVIAGKGSRPYGVAMAAATFRLLMLVALVLMPFGMAGAPATAQPMPADHAAMSMAMGHCDEQPTKETAPTSSKMDCTAMCTALPAADNPLPVKAMKPVALRSTAIAAPFVGIEPELATPPPRQG